MIQLPVIRWGQPYESLEFDQVTHFATGEPIAKVGRANAGMIQRDMRKAQAARDALTAIDIEDLIQRVVRAGELYMKATLPMGDGTQNPDEFIRAQSASTGSSRTSLPDEHAEACVRPYEHPRHSDGADARTGSPRADARIRRGARHPHQLPGSNACARSGASVEFAGCPHLVDADHSHAGRTRAQARTAGTLDALSNRCRILRSRNPA